MTDTTAAPLESPVGEGHGGTHHAPPDSHYYRIAIALALITAVEVGWSYLPIWDDATGIKSVIEVGGLVLMMSIKFVIVASHFMHLKFDDKLLSRLFYAGLLLAVGVYVAALTTFQIWGSQNLGYK